MNTLSLVSTEQRKFLLVLIGASLTLWNISFEVGAWGQIFYEHFFYIWVLSLALGIAVFFFPNVISRVSLLEKLALIFPSFWLAVSIIAASLFEQTQWLDNLLSMGLLLSVFCLPLLFLMLVSLLEPDAVSLKRRDNIKLFVVLLIVSGSGFITGKYNYVFMNCDDFLIAGSSAPDTCRSESKLSSIFNVMD